MEHRFEQKVKTVAEAMETETNAQAAEALSQLLLPTNHRDYLKVLNAIQEQLKSDGLEERGNNQLGIADDRNFALVGSNDPKQDSRVVIMPGTNLTKICRFELGDDVKHSQKEINSCLDANAKINKLADPDKLTAGKTLLHIVEWDVSLHKWGTDSRRS